MNSTAESSSRPLCSLCSQRYAIYTCPRCTIRTCSLPCSSAHKTQGAGCSGARDKAAYVPMNRYGWGTMMDDYTFLEDVGRQVGEWGGEIARGKFQNRGRGTARGGRGRGRGGGTSAGRTKRDVLRAQLEASDIGMDLLPAGMERNKLNQSSWDSKTQTALLTIEFTFHPSPNPLAPQGQAVEQPYKLLTHRNRTNTPLLAHLQRAVSDRKDCPAWARALVRPDPSDDSFTPPQCVLPASQRTFYRLDPSQPLLDLLRGRQFVEFPSIGVWEEFRGTIVDVGGAITQLEEDTRPPKRRRVDRKAGKMIAGLLDGYGSSSGAEEEEKKQDGLEMLEGYSESEEGEAVHGDSDDDVEELEPAALLELLRAARGDATWTPHTEEDEVVDWGDDSEGEV
ncbi:hypothetical protein FB45DRAFT_405975 [Roridomyces roridus]|uniref:HIT-type domain-containing protein n=1 Tax=Roridomyces roridus TaxID=1738132 RepID=A0AAD7C496_9AGAR|nr:hypothetical protein FB45DRAFT_405975 [Roridomyces roridus]